MTSRERTLACLREKPIDRLPLVHFGFWRDTLLKWAQEGHLTHEEAMAYEDGNEIDARLCERLGFDHCWTCACAPNNYLDPFFEEVTVKDLPDGSRHVLNSHGIDLVSVDCDGCIDTLVPHWLDAGVNILFPIEVGTWNASIGPWREQYGKALKGIGGVRKSVFAGDKAAVDAEIERLKALPVR